MYVVKYVIQKHKLVLKHALGWLLTMDMYEDALEFKLVKGRQASLCIAYTV